MIESAPVCGAQSAMARAAITAISHQSPIFNDSKIKDPQSPMIRRLRNVMADLRPGRRVKVAGSLQASEGRGRHGPTQYIPPPLLMQLSGAGSLNTRRRACGLPQARRAWLRELSLAARLFRRSLGEGGHLRAQRFGAQGRPGLPGESRIPDPLLRCFRSCGGQAELDRIIPRHLDHLRAGNPVVPRLSVRLFQHPQETEPGHGT